MCLLKSVCSRNPQWRHILFLHLFTSAFLYSSPHTQQNIILVCIASSLQATSTQNGCSGSWSSQSQNKNSVFCTWFQPVKRPAAELTCAGIVIDPDVARMADAHEGARGVNAHGILPAVVLPFSTLINIWEKGERRGERENKAVLDVDCYHMQLNL